MSKGSKIKRNKVAASRAKPSQPEAPPEVRTSTEMAVAVRKKLQDFVATLPEEERDVPAAQALLALGIVLSTRIAGVETARTTALRLFEQLEAMSQPGGD